LNKRPDEKEIQEYEEIERTIIEIATGLRFKTVINKQVLFRFPRPEETQRIEGECEKIKVLAKQDGLWTRKEMREFMEKENILTKEEHNNIINLENRIENYQKKEKRTFDPVGKAQLLEEMKKLQIELDTLEAVEGSFIVNTIESKVNEAKCYNLVGFCVMDLDKKPYWGSIENYWKSNKIFLAKALIPEYLRFARGIPTPLIRKIARSNMWRARWASTTNTASPIFEGTITNWNINQINLCYWSKTYDTIYNHPECPEDRIVDNDDLLDKWIGMKHKENDMERRKMKDNQTGSGSPDTDGKTPGKQYAEEKHNFFFN